MEKKLKLALCFTLLNCATHSIAYFKITNNSGATIQIYLTGWGYEWMVLESDGNLAYNHNAQIETEGKYRFLKPGQNTTYDWAPEDDRANTCLKDLMVNFKADSKAESFVKAEQKENFTKGCQHQAISLTRVNGKPVAIFTYIKKEDKKETPQS